MKFKKHGMRHEGKESGAKEAREHLKNGYSKMEAFEKGMHGKGYKGYKAKK